LPVISVLVSSGYSLRRKVAVMLHLRCFGVFPLFLASCAVAQAQTPTTSASLSPSTLPVREVTVFKDGHAYVVREAPLPEAALGRVVLDELPTPVLGTFWPYASGGARLVQAKAGREQVTKEVDALELGDMLRVNVGRKMRIKDVMNDEVEGTLRSAPSRESASDGRLPVLLLETANGMRAMPVQQVRWLQIEGDVERRLRVTEAREQLTLSVEGGGPKARVGVVYVQRGLRWIPSYRLDIDGAGKARVQMQATLVNDLIDLKDAAVNLVIGVPSFAFEDLVDPIALQEELAAVSARTRSQSAFSNALSNSLMSQVANYGAEPRPGESGGAKAIGGSANEDLYVFTVEHVTLAKGERLVLPLREFELSYRDVYTLDVKLAPPASMRPQLSSEQVLQLARDQAAPKVKHVLRLKNTADAPLTTAPALVLSNGRVLAQGRMTYAPVGVECDVEINTALDVCVETEERESSRTPDAVRWNGDAYGLIDMAGVITLRNEKRQPVELEVRRSVLGLVHSVGADGQMKQLDLVALGNEASTHTWWGWWSWPYWWFHFNGYGEFRWKLTLAPGASKTLDASWRYYWR
jgi:hypothetical protein